MSLPRGRLALTVRRVVAAETCKASEQSSIAQSTSVPSQLLRAPFTAESTASAHVRPPPARSAICTLDTVGGPPAAPVRSEERRGGHECVRTWGYRGWADQ